MPKVACADKATRNDLLYTWVKSFGRFKSDSLEYNKFLDTLDYYSVTDYGWLGDTVMLGAQLSDCLENLRWAKRESNIYIRPNSVIPLVPQFDIGNYPLDIDYDAGYKLVALYKFWNIIEYFSPYKQLIDENWETILLSYIPCIIESDGLEFKYAMANLIAEIHDAHAMCNFEFVFGDKRIPVDTRLIGDKLIVIPPNQFSDSTNMIFKPGDEIISVDDRTVQATIAFMRQYSSWSNEASLRLKAVNYATVSKNSRTKVVYKHNSKIKDTVITVMSDRMLNQDIMSKLAKRKIFSTLNDSVGYLYPAVYDEKFDIKALKKVIFKTKALIIDHRCYPLLTSAISRDLFIESGAYLAIFSIPILQLPGCFRYAPVVLPKEEKNVYQGKIIVLVDENTASMGEYTTMELQTRSNTIVVGSQTAGTDGNVAGIMLPDGMSTGISSLGVFYPDGTPTQRVGVKIDYYVEPTIEGIKAGRDEVLEKAMEIIYQK